MNPKHCRHLRTKKLFIGSNPEEAFGEREPDQASPTHVWCNLTQSVVGMDDLPASPDKCVAPRSCCEQ